MAKIYVEIIVIKLSKLTRDDASESDAIAGADVTSSLEAVAQELVGSGVIVEVIKEEDYSYSYSYDEVLEKEISSAEETQKEIPKEKLWRAGP